MCRLLVALAFAACAASLSACGSSHAGSACPPRVAAVLGGARSTVRSQSLDVVMCDYRAAGAGGADVRVTVDTAPQTLVRFERWVVERGQAYLGASEAELPQVLEWLGDGAAWVAAARELVAVGNGRLVTVLVRRGEPGRSLLATATKVARAALVTGGASGRAGRALST